MPWWGWLIVYAVSYTGSLRTIVRRAWVAPKSAFTVRTHGERVGLACLAAVPLAFVWPCVVVAMRETRPERVARKRAELAEFDAREAKALAKRAEALGLAAPDGER